MHTPHETSGLTPFKLLGNLIRARDSSGKPDYSLDAPETWTPLDFETRRELVQELAERIASDGPPHQHPWRGVGRDALDPSEMQSLRDAIDALAASLMNLVVCAERACTLFGLSLPESFGEMARLLKVAEAAAAMPECDRRAFCSPAWARAEDVAEIVEKGERFSKLRHAFDSAFVESAWAASLDECRATLAAKSRSWFRWLSSRYREQVSLLKSYLKVPLPKSAEQRLLLVDGLIAAQLARRSFEELQEAGLAAFGADWRKDKSDWARLGSLTSWWSAFPKEGLPEDGRDRLARLTAEDRRSFALFRENFEAAKSIRMTACWSVLLSKPLPAGGNRLNASRDGSRSWTASVSLGKTVSVR